MPRLIRIAITLFIAATILTFLANQRVQEAKEHMGEGNAEEITDYARNQAQMGMIGILLAGIMIIIAFVLMIIEVSRMKKKALEGGDER